MLDTPGSGPVFFLIADGVPSTQSKPFEAFNDWLQTLEPLSWLSSIVAGLLGLSVVFAGFRPHIGALWHSTPWMETKRLNDLSRARNLAEFERTVRAKEAGSRDFARLGLTNDANLTSKFYILPRTYVEAFIEPNNNVYGYSIMLRRPGWLGTIRASHHKVKLGRTTFRNLPRGTIVTPSQRDFAYFEVEQSSKVPTYQGFAAGISSGNTSGLPLSYCLLLFPLALRVLGRSDQVRHFQERMERGLRSIRDHYNLEGEHTSFLGTQTSMELPTMSCGAATLPSTTCQWRIRGMLF
ncbi:hypothetical protein PJL18_00298 [Paenarthrobacter nicotinovorans]|nr:hypothetical protein [Paenarthrobacter nicotinovorans]